MDQLSSCYFCGTALDEPLATHLLGRDEPAARIVLCPSCHRKLETAFDAAGVGSDALSPVDASDPTRDLGETGNDTDTLRTDVQSEPASPDRSGPATGTDEPTATDDGPGAGGTRSDDGSEASTAAENADSTDDDPVSADADASDILVDPEGDDPLDEPAGSETDDADSDEGDPIESDERSDADEDEISFDVVGSEAETVDGESDVTAESGETEGPAEPSGGAETADAASGKETTADTRSGGAEAADGASTENADDGVARGSISALEYNKVMRLLQNREFPVDRQEIIVVSTNAYGLSETECEQAIDLAVDRGLIEKDGGQLLRPE